jgi:hypothetical protein
MTRARRPLIHTPMWPSEGGRTYVHPVRDGIERGGDPDTIGDRSPIPKARASRLGAASREHDASQLPDRSIEVVTVGGSGAQGHGERWQLLSSRVDCCA